MKTKKYSLHQIQNPDQFGFNPNDYSRFKYGDDHVSKKFGDALAQGFIDTHLKDNFPTAQLVVISSPYSFIPTATFAMKNHFVSYLNRWLVANNLPTIQETKVHRTITYKEDYGELDAAQRMKLIGNDSFHIDASFVEGKVLLFLDDIRITGSHERVILKMAKEFELKNEVYMLYFAELVNKNVHPRFENYLNYHFVKSIFDLQEIITDENFKINTRLVKFILNYDSKDFLIFIKSQSDSFINQLYDMAIGNGYHTIEVYSVNLEMIRDYFSVES